MDPRVKTPEEVLGMQFSAAMRIVEALQRSLQETLGRWDALRQQGAGLGVVGR